jgi:hypothetical protein
MDRTLGRLLLYAGLALAMLGVLILVSPRLPWLGRLPGDIRIARDGFSLFVPLTTCVLLSLLVTLVWNLIAKR